METSVQYNVNNEPIVISKLVTDILLKTSNPSDNMGLYWFLYQTAKWRNNFTFQATTNYIRTGLHWSKERVTNAKKELLRLKLIKIIQKREKGIFVQQLIHVVVIGWDQHNINDDNHKPLSPLVAKQAANINSTNSLKEKENTSYFPKSEIVVRKRKVLNGNNTNKENEWIERIKQLEEQLKMSELKSTPIQSELFEVDQLITPNHFEIFWQLYPRKATKGSALSAFSKLCTQKSRVNVRPTLKMVKTALQMQIKSELWTKEPQFIPYPATWLNNNGWLNDPNEMKVFQKDVKVKPNEKRSFGFVGKPIKYNEPIEM